MSVILLLLFVYAVGIAGICIMKKMQPEDKIYPVWVVIVCVLLTVFVVWYIS